MRVDQREVQAAAPGGPHHRVDVGIVLQDRRDGVALTQSGLPKEVCQPVGTRLQLGEVDHRLRRIQDDGRPAGVGMLTDLHGFTL